MKILICSLNYAPEPIGIGKYSSEMAEWLVQAGHEVRVVCAPPYYPDWKVGAGYSGRRYTRELLHGVQVHRAPLWVPARPGGLTRIVHLLSFAASSLPVVARQVFWRPDVVWVAAPAFFCAPGAWLTARLCGAKAWLHVQDFEIDVAFKLGMLEGGKLKRVVSAAERWMLQRFDRVSSISQRMLARLGAKGVARSRIVNFPNWVNVDHIQPLQGPSSYRRELGIADDAIVALYSGSLGAKHGLGLIPQAARQLAHLDKLVFVVCGNGVFKPQLEAAAAELPNLRLLPLQPLEMLGELLGMADIHLLPQSPGAEDLVMPSKLSGMLASGRPVVATCRPDTELASVVGRAGLVVPPEDGNAMARAIEQLARQPALRTALGAEGRAYAEEQLVSGSVLGRFEAELVRVVSTPQPEMQPEARPAFRPDRRAPPKPQYALGLGLKKMAATCALAFIPLASLAPTVANSTHTGQLLVSRIQVAPAKIAQQVSVLAFGVGRSVQTPSHASLPEPSQMLLALMAALAACALLRFRREE